MADDIDIPGILARQPLFAGAAPDDLAAVAKRLRRHQWNRGALIFARGDPAADLMIVLSGKVRLSVMASDGRELSLRIAGPETVIGEIAVLDGGTRTADATALADVRAALLGRGDLERLLTDRPVLALSAIRMLCGRLRDTTDQLESIALYRIEARLARLFLGLARQVDPEAVRSVKIRFDLSQSHLAEIVGASRPKVNRALLALEEGGAIRRDASDLVCRIEALQTVADAEDQAL